MPRAAAKRTSIEAAFLVEEARAEWDDPTPDHELLEELAISSGGTFVELAGIRQLPDAIPDRTITETVGRAASTIWDSAALMVLLCGLMILEWSLRKWWRLN